MTFSKTRIAITLAAAFAAACAEPTAMAFRLEQPGVLQLVGYETQSAVEPDRTLSWSVPPGPDVYVPAQLLVAPDTVHAGQTFHVSVTTVGLSGCWSATGQTVATGDGVVELTPFDVHSGAGVCTEILLNLTHTSAITIATPGEWVVKVTGRRVRQGDAAWEEPVVVRKTVVVL